MSVQHLQRIRIQSTSKFRWSDYDRLRISDFQPFFICSLFPLSLSLCSSISLFIQTWIGSFSFSEYKCDIESSRFYMIDSIIGKRENCISTFIYATAIYKPSHLSNQIIVCAQIYEPIERFIPLDLIFDIRKYNVAAAMNHNCHSLWSRFRRAQTIYGHIISDDATISSHHNHFIYWEMGVVN